MNPEHALSDEGSLRAKRGVTHANGGSGIEIKPSHEGSLHTALGVPQGQKIPTSELATKPSDSPAISKKKNFARNAKGWGH